MKRRNRQILLGVVLGACVSVAAVAAVSAFGAAAHTEQSLGVPTPIANQFAAVGNQSLPAAPAAIIANFAELHAGIGTPRHVGRDAYIASYNGAVCIVFRPGSSGCTDQLDHGVWLFGDMIRASDSEQAPFNVNLYGVAEDGVLSLTVALTNGKTRTIPVVNNAFRATFGNTMFSQIQGISVNSSAGQSTLDPRQYFPSSLPTFGP
jgi:hypothetical protein